MLTAALRELELATGPDRALDRAIASAIGWQRKNGEVGEDDYWKWGDWSWTREDNEHPPRYTASIDAALMLVPKGSQWKVGFTGTPLAWMYAGGDWHHDWGWTKYHGATPALALCIAALKAREAQP